MTEPKSLITDVNQALEGNQQSYRALYDYITPILRKTIRRKIYGIPSHMLKDVLQDIIVKVFLKLSTFKSGNSFTCWAISIAVHHAIDLSRKKKLDIEFSDCIELHALHSAEFYNSNIEENPSFDIFDISCKHLDEEHKSLIIEKYFIGLKQKEIAQKINKPLGSISGLQASAVEQLRRRIFELRLDWSDFM